MYNKKMSPAENFALDLITGVGCISIYQLNYMLYRFYGKAAKPTVIEAMVHSFEGKGVAHFSECGKYVIAGKSNKDKYKKVNKDTVMAIAVALETINDPEDYRSIYRPFYGEDLVFMSNNKAYGVLINTADNINKPLYYQKQYDDLKKKLEKKKVFDEDMIEDACEVLLITYPEKVNPRSALKNIEALELTMPHALCFLKGEITERPTVKILGLTSEE